LMNTLGTAKAQQRFTGFIAQEVEAAAQSLGYDFSGVQAPQNEHDHYSLAYAEFVVPAVKAIQEQQAQIETLKQEKANLEQRLSQLEAQMQRLLEQR